MDKKVITGIMLTLLLTSVLTLAFNIQPVKASGTIYIRPDGSVEGTDKIQRDGDVYTFTDNIYDSIFVEKDNIVVDGAGYTLHGTGSGTGIYLSGRSNVTIKNVEIEAFGHGIYVLDSSNNSIIENNITTNKYDGITFVSSSSNTVTGNKITASDMYGIWLRSSSNYNTISGNNLTDNRDGIWLTDSSNYNNILENKIANIIWHGIRLQTSSNNSIYRNCITNSMRTGIFLFWDSDNNTISENTLTAHDNYGIRLSYVSNHNSIFRNNITNNNYGISFAGTFSNSIFRNKIVNNTSGILFHHSSNNTIFGNYVTANNYISIEFRNSTHNNVYRNNIINNNDGIKLFQSSNNNSISENNITASNRYGVALYDSSNNRFYHNNLIDNSKHVYFFYFSCVNVWDDGYPSGGNYWSDHVTVDDYSGVNQDEPGSDGIVDEPYVIDADNRDNYPLVKPWSPVISATVDIYPDALNLRGGGKWTTAYIQLPEGYNAEDVDAATILLNETISPILGPMYEFVTNSSEYLVDHNEDGILERMVKFDKSDVMALLSIGEATLTITGEVNGTPFEGSDSIRVISPSTGSGGCKGFKK